MNGSTSNGDHPEADRGLEAAGGGALVALFSIGSPPPSDTEYRRIVRLLLSKVVAIVRSEYDVTWKAVADDRFLSPAFAAADGRKWDRELNSVIGHCCDKILMALRDPACDDFRPLVSDFVTTVISFARRLRDHAARDGRGRSTQLVDGPDGPVNKRLYADRRVRLDDASRRGDQYSQEVARGLAEDRVAEYKAIIAEAHEKASPKDRRTLHRCLAGASAAKASKGTGQTGQTVINRQRRLLREVAPGLKVELARGKSRKAVAKEHLARGGGKDVGAPPRRAGRTDGPSPRREPGE